MSLRSCCAIAVFAASLSCSMSLHGSSSGLFAGRGQSSSTRAPAESSPAAEAPRVAAASSDEAEPSAVSKRDGKRPSKSREPSAQDSAGPVMAGAPALGFRGATGPAPSAAWNGTYRRDEQPECGDQLAFDPRGADVQTVHAPDWDYHPGFRCPGGCTNTAQVTLSKGKASFPLVWVDDHPPFQGDGYQVTMRRYRFEVPLQQLDDKSGFAGAATVKAPVFHWSHNNIYDMQSDAFSVELGFWAVTDAHWGSGRSGLFRVLLHDAGADDPQAFDDSAEAACKVVLVRTDWKAGDGLYDSDDGDAGESQSSASSSSSSSRGSDSSARRSCKSQCRQQAGACRTSCHGSSAKCASNCNHDESACERGCG